MTGQLPNTAKKKSSAIFFLIPFLIIIALWAGNIFFLYRHDKPTVKDESKVVSTLIPEDAVYDENGRLQLDGKGNPIREKEIGVIRYDPQYVVTKERTPIYKEDRNTAKGEIPAKTKLYHTKRKDEFVFCTYTNDADIPDSGWVSIDDIKKP